MQWSNSSDDSHHLQKATDDSQPTSEEGAGFSPPKAVIKVLNTQTLATSGFLLFGHNYPQHLKLLLIFPWLRGIKDSNTLSDFQCILQRIKSIFCEQHTRQPTESILAFSSGQKLLQPYRIYYQITYLRVSASISMFAHFMPTSGKHHSANRDFGKHPLTFPTLTYPYT